VKAVASYFLIETHSLPGLARRYPRGFILITRTAPCLRQLPVAALPSTRAISDRDVFYVAHPIHSILTSYFLGHDPISRRFSLALRNS
jgi:hypothetical protein